MKSIGSFSPRRGSDEKPPSFNTRIFTDHHITPTEAAKLLEILYENNAVKAEDAELYGKLIEAVHYYWFKNRN